MKNNSKENGSEISELFSDLFPDLDLIFTDEDGEQFVSINNHKRNKRNFHKWLDNYEEKMK